MWGLHGGYVQIIQVIVIALISFDQQALVEPALICSGLVAADQKDGLSLRIKGKSHSPRLSLSGKPQLFHIGVSGALECVDRGSTQMRSEFGQQTSMRQQLILQTLRQTLELCVEWIVKDNRPGHLNYVLNNIIWSNPAKRRFLLEPLPLGFSVFAMSACPC